MFKNVVAKSQPTEAATKLELRRIEGKLYQRKYKEKKTASATGATDQITEHTLFYSSLKQWRKQHYHRPN